MFVIVDFDLSVEEYTARGIENDFPQIDRCPHCKGVVTLRRHGFYWRNAIEGESLHRIPICRLKCPSCQKTVSLLPNFLIPYYQYTLDTVLGKVEGNLIHQVISGCRQLVSFYRKRFMNQLNQIEMFFRDDGFREALPGDIKERAIKLLEMILALGKASFLRRSTGHFLRNFMAQ